MAINHVLDNAHGIIQGQNNLHILTRATNEQNVARAPTGNTKDDNPEDNDWECVEMPMAAEDTVTRSPKDDQDEQCQEPNNDVANGMSIESKNVEEPKSLEDLMCNEMHKNAHTVLIPHAWEEIEPLDLCMDNDRRHHLTMKAT